MLPIQPSNQPSARGNQGGKPTTTKREVNQYALRFLKGQCRKVYMAPYEQATTVAQRFFDFAKIFAKKCVRILAEYDLRGHEDGVHACILYTVGLYSM